MHERVDGKTSDLKQFWRFYLRFELFEFLYGIFRNLSLFSKSCKIELERTLWMIVMHLMVLLNLIRRHPLSTYKNIFRKTYIRTCAYQGIRNVGFSENFANVLNRWSLISSKQSHWLHLHCMKSVQIRSFFWSVFSPNVGKYGPEKTPHLDTFYAVLRQESHMV